MKKKIIGFLLTIIAILGGGYYYQDKLGSPFGPERHLCQTATTSPDTFYKADGMASSSCYVYVGDAVNIRLNWAVKASTTLTQLLWENYFSYDDSSATRNWFAQREIGYNYDNASRTWSAEPILNTWTPANANASTTYASILLENPSAKWLKIDYAIASTTEAQGNGEVYLEIIKNN